MIFIDTNVISETMRPAPDPKVMGFLAAHDARLALSSVVIAEVTFGIERIRPDERARRLDINLLRWRGRLASRIFSLDEEAALIAGRIMGAELRRGRTVELQDALIAAIALKYRAILATRNVDHFQFPELTVVNPWIAAAI